MLSTFVDLITPTLRLRTSDNSIRVGEHVRVHVHLSMDDTIDRGVKIVASYGDWTHKVAAFNVDKSDDGSVRLAPLYNVEYWAVSAGDVRHESVHSNRDSVKVHAKVTTALSRYYGTKNGLRLFHKSTNPLYKISVALTSTREKVDVLLQKKTSNGWKSIAGGSFELRSGSNVTLAINSGSLARNVTYRTIAFFKSTRSALGVSKWEYFRFT